MCLRAENFNRNNIALGFAAVFLFTLPFSHYAGLRLTSLILAAVSAWTIRGELQVPVVPLKFPLIFWLAIALTSLIWARDFRYSLQEVRIEIGYGITAFAVFFSLTRSSKECVLWFLVLISSLLITSISALVGYVHSDFAFSWGLQGGIGTYGTYLITIMPSMLLLLASRPLRGFSTRLKWLLIPIILVSGYLTDNRIFWVAAALMIVTFTCLVSVTARRRRVDVLKRAVAICGISVVLLGSAFVAVSMQRTQSDPVTLGQSIENDPRIGIWEFAVQQISQRPFTGVGFGRISDREVFKAISPSGFIQHAHNLFLDYALEMGVGGIVAIILLFGFIVREFWRLYRAPDRTCSLIGAAGLTLILGVVVKNMTDDLFLRQNALLFWSLVGSALGYGVRLQLKSRVANTDFRPPRYTVQS